MKLVRPGIAVVTLVLALAVPLGTSAVAAPSVVQSTGSITGHIQMAGNPVAGACINAIGDGAQGGQAQSASDGSYTVTGISPGDYSVEFLPCSGNASPTNFQSAYYGQQTDGSPTTVSVTAGNQVALGNQTVVPGGEIDIKLTDALGNTLSTDTFPQAWLMDKSFLGPPMGTSRQPDVNGYWHLIGLRPQAYEIEYGYCGPTCRRGVIGYYAGQGVRGTPTPVVPVAGGPATVLTDVVTIPTESVSNTDLTVSPAAPSAGQSVTLTATVTDQTGAIPTGSMWFLSSNADLGSPGLDLGDAAADLNSQGVASITSGPLAEGTYQLWTAYFGDGESKDNLSPPITVTVGPAVRGGGGGSAPASGNVTAGGTLTSDPAGTTPDASNPLVVGVTSPVGGAVTIDKTAPNTPIGHYSVLGVGATIAAPTATAGHPLHLTFQVFDGTLPAGSHPSDLTIFRDGVAISACTDASATPDPCVASVTTSGGVTTFDVLSSHASTWDVEAAHVGRVAGPDRLATAVAVSQDSFPNGHAGAVVLARADDYPDALVGGPLAAAKNAPLLLTQGIQLPTVTATELSRVLPAGGTVYVLGGIAAVPTSVTTQLTGVGYHVVRYAGADRYTTAATVAAALGSPATVLLASGMNFPDALTAGPAAAHVHGAILLTSGSTMPKVTADYIATAQSVYAIGGPAAAAAPTAVPVVGVDRFETAALVAAKFFPSSTIVGVATGAGFPDALAGGAQLALLGGPLLLASQVGVPRLTTEYLGSDHSALTNIYVYGGAAVLGNGVVSQLAATFSS